MYCHILLYNYCSLPSGLHGHPGAELEPARVLPLCLLQDRLQPVGFQGLDTLSSRAGVF